LFLPGNVVHQAFFWVQYECFVSILTESLVGRMECAWLQISLAKFKNFTQKSPEESQSSGQSDARY
jgi:hypothetical protein